MTFVACPECGAPAELVDEYELPSTEGPVAHFVTRCVNRHTRTQVDDLQ